MIIDELKKVAKDSLTGIDGASYDGMKVVGYPAWVLAVLVFLGSALKDIGLHATTSLDYQQFGIGFASLCGSLAIIAAGVALKKNTEPQPPSPKDTP